ncbi:MAG: ATP-binding cassette domain-containing protein [Bacilli bacterium]|nr:ATP-binding cassette domain-containing protein [Bacilli bacterium]
MENNNYAIEMLNITKKFGPLYANKNVTLKIKKGEIHALLGENGAGKSTIMSILFGLYSPDEGKIKVNGKEVKIKDPNDANDLKIGMVHQHFKLVECYTLLENIILGKEIAKNHFVEDAEKREQAIMTRLYIIEGLIRFLKLRKDLTEVLKTAVSDNDLRFILGHDYHFTQSQTNAILSLPISELNDLKEKELQKEAKELREKFFAQNEKKPNVFQKAAKATGRGLARFADWWNKTVFNVDLNKAAYDITEISRKYGLGVDLNCVTEDATVGMQQRTEILKMLYRNADILIFDEPTAVLSPQEIEGLLLIMKNLKREGKTIIFITHKLNEIKAVADRVTVLRRGETIGTYDVKKTPVNKLSDLMVGRHVTTTLNKSKKKPGKRMLSIRNLTMFDNHKKKNVVNKVNFDVREGEIVSIAGIDGNGQTELIYGITGIEKQTDGTVQFADTILKKGDIKERNALGMSHIPEDRHKHGLVLDYDLKQNLVLRDFKDSNFQRFGFIKNKSIKTNADKLIGEHDIRSSNGANSSARGMSGGNQQKAIIAREIARKPKVLVAVQPTRGVDVGAIENIHTRLLKEKERGTAILLVSYELDEVFALSDRILVMYEGEIVGEFKPKDVTRQELGLYMSGAKRNYQFVEGRR